MIPVIVPARMGSTRFPGKPLANILGKPMILWVCEAAAIALGQENVIVATDSKEIADVARESGFDSIFTSPECKTGTDRVAEAMRLMGVMKAVNVQGDEPLIEPELITQVASRLELSSHVLNLASHLSPSENPEDSSIPKLVVAESGSLLYASRSAIPGSKVKGNLTRDQFLKQVCVYGFNLENLVDFGQNSNKTPLEALEDIELLGFIERGIRVEIIATQSQSIAVDHPRDIRRVELALERSARSNSS